jgi:hypothetical protein
MSRGEEAVRKLLEKVRARVKVWLRDPLDYLNGHTLLVRVDTPFLDKPDVRVVQITRGGPEFPAILRVLLRSGDRGGVESPIVVNGVEFSLRYARRSST